MRKTTTVSKTRGVRERGLRIAIITSEVTPFSKTGGLGDVCHALPLELSKRGHEVIVISPLYRHVRGQPLESTPYRVRVPLRSEIGEGRVAKAGIHYFLDYPAFFDRDGLYGTVQGDYPDNAARFKFLSRGALELIKALGWRPNVVHVHDWQTGLVPIYMRTQCKETFAKVPSVLTIHNLAYQGLFWHLDMPLLGLDWALFNWRQLEYYGKINLLKGGLVFADAITTVSPTYAKEILTADHGCGLEGVLASRADCLTGILNGIDAEVWNPETDPHLPVRYSERDMTGKAACKKALQERLGFQVRPETPLIAFIGRLTEQKGLDILVSAAEFLAQLNLQLVVLGSGEDRFSAPLERLGRLYGTKLRVHVAYDEALAHLIEAGADFFLMPSRYEPCGLNQMYSMRYGTVPIVRRTGGLADTVVAGQTGILFEDYSSYALVDAVGRALALWADRPAYTRMQREGMNQDFSWAASAAKYEELYRRAIASLSR